MFRCALFGLVNRSAVLVARHLYMHRTLRCVVAWWIAIKHLIFKLYHALPSEVQPWYS